MIEGSESVQIITDPGSPPKNTDPRDPEHWHPLMLAISVPDPNPDPQDPQVFGPPDLDLLVRGMVLDPDPSIIKQK